jgi:hypothetical protein
MVWSGANNVENEAMNFYKYCDAPKKLLTSVTFVGTRHFRMTSIFVGSILCSPPSITYPKYTKEY